MTEDLSKWEVRTLAGSVFTVSGELVIDYPLVTVRAENGVPEFAASMDNLDYIVLYREAVEEA